MAEPRQKTGKEIQDEFFDNVYQIIECLETEEHTRSKPAREKMELLVFSMMNIFDGTSCSSGCGFLLVPTCHPSDPAYHQDNGENWYPVNEKVERIAEGEISCGEMLHDAFLNHPGRKH